MDIKQINSAIMFGTWTNVELDSIVSAIKFARTGLQKQVKRGLNIGTEVKFRSTKRGITVHGTVQKIAQKYVTVHTMTGLWRVPMNMLEVV
jgi:hypothetical protein